MNRNWRSGFFSAAIALALLFATGFAIAAPADNPQILYSFCSPQLGACGEASYPTALVRGPDGAYYGITKGNFAGTFGSGVVYRADPATRKVSIFHRFDTKNGGVWPLWLVAGSDGNLYGAVYIGAGPDTGYIYRLSLAGEFTKLHTYSVSGGHYPSTVPPVEVGGSWYGLASQGRVGSEIGIYQLTSDGRYRIFYRFTDGGYFTYPLVLAPDGNLYGLNSSYPDPTIFRVEPNQLDPVVTVVHVFDDTTEANPYSGLTIGPDQALYGTVVSSNREAMFRMSLDGQFTLMNTFGDAPPSGPPPPLTLMPDGYFYSSRTRGGGGLPYESEIFRLSLTGEYAQLHVFASNDEGDYPMAALIRGFDNALYGTNSSGGKNNGGTLFRYVPPPVQ